MFRDFVDTLYERKADSQYNESVRAINKLLLNSLYGLMGARQETHGSKIIDRSDYQALADLQSQYSVNAVYPILDKFIFVYTIPAEGPGERRYYNSKPEGLKFCNIVLASYITARARIHMHKLMTKLREQGINVYYTDTDSVFIDQELSDETLVGAGIGQLKLEYPKIKEGYFLNSKAYGLELETGAEIIKFKGLPPKSLRLNDFRQKYYHNKDFRVDKEQIVGKNKF